MDSQLNKKKKLAKILAFTNQKGGVGKTTSAVNIALSLAVTEVKTLLIDLDPQANATTGLSDLFEKSNSNIYDVLIKGKSFFAFIRLCLDLSETDISLK